MKENFDKSLALVLKSEGGFVNHPADPGGMTNLGVTKKTWEDWVRRPVTEQEMRSLTPADVAPLYKSRYWNACRCDDLPSGVDYMVFDFGVNAGPGQARKTLQKAVGTSVDGVIGEKTLAAVQNTPNLLEKFSLQKEAFYRSLPTFEIFGRGWLNRIHEVEAAARTFSAV